MKKLLPFVVIISLLVAGCSDLPESDVLDFTLLSSTMFSAEYNNIATSPADYLGKTMRVSGSYEVFFFQAANRFCHFVIVVEGDACCPGEGFEFKVSDERTFPDDYPPEGQKIEVTGVFSSYEEMGHTFYYLAVDDIIVLA